MKAFLPFVTLLLFAFQLQGQTKMNLSLKEVIGRARANSPDAQLAKTQLTRSYWDFRVYRSRLKPKIYLEATLPSLNRGVSTYIDSTGSQSYVPVSNVSNQAYVYLSQVVPGTGGTAFVKLGLERTDNFGRLNGTSYYSTPVNIGFDQPLFRLNPYKWDKKIEPLRYKKAQLQNIESLENAALQSVGLFFDLYIAQIELEAARVDKINADTLYTLSKGRFEVGKIAENELLQVELSVMNAKSQVSNATLQQSTATEALRNFLNIKENVAFELTVPDSIPEVLIDAEKALAEAKKNRSIATDHQLRLLEAQKGVATAKANNGVNATLEANFGLSKSANTLQDAYNHPLDQERVTLTLSVPLADWGKAESERQTAQSELELQQLTVQQEALNFERMILLKVQQFYLVRDRVDIAKKSYEVAMKSYDIAQKRYRIGKVGITDLNQAFSSLQASRSGYYQALRSYWYALYEIRRLTLYDFEEGKTLGDE